MLELYQAKKANFQQVYGDEIAKRVEGERRILKLRNCGWWLASSYQTLDSQNPNFSLARFYKVAIVDELIEVECKNTRIATAE